MLLIRFTRILQLRNVLVQAYRDGRMIGTKHEDIFRK